MNHLSTVDPDIACHSELGFRTNSGTAQVELESREKEQS